MLSDVYWKRLAVVIMGSTGSALIIHACGVHFRSEAPVMATGTLLIWMSLALGFVR